MAALAMTRGIVHLEAAVLEAICTAEANPAVAGATLSTLKDEVNCQVATPLVHALCLAGSYFNELTTRRCKRIAKGVRDLQLGKWLEAAPESTTKLFPSDVESAMQASRTHRTDSLIAMASHSSRTTPKAPSSSFTRGRRYEPFRPQRQPFPGGYPWGQANRRRHFSSRGRPSAATASPKHRDNAAA